MGSVGKAKFFEIVLSYASKPAIVGAAKNTISMISRFHTDRPRICRQTCPERMLWSLAGGPLMTCLSGGSVAKAKAANVSMMRLTHKSWTADKGDSKK